MQKVLKIDSQVTMKLKKETLETHQKDNFLFLFDWKLAKHNMIQLEIVQRTT